MKTLINFNNSQEDLERYRDKQDIRNLCAKYGCDGLEYMRIPACSEAMIPQEMVYGIHLSSFQNWMDLWFGNTERLLQEFGSMEVVRQFYGGTDKQAILDKFTKELDYAQKSGAEYVVYHISEVTIKESFSYRFYYTDEEIVDAAAEIINLLLDDKGYTFDFLMENLWWPGMNLANPQVTKRLFEQIHYNKKGMMLDTGHLLSTNRRLRTQDEGVQYIHHILDLHAEQCKWIKGVHFHQSLSGEYIDHILGQKIELKADYWERFGQVYEYIFLADKHEPFTAPGVKDLIERMHPEYLTYEFITRNREEQEKFLARQIAVL